jgi:integrase
MSGKRDYGDGGIEQRGPDVWRVTYRLDGRRFRKTVRGGERDARKELRRLIKSTEDGEHVAPDRLTLAAWVDHWIAIGAPGRRKKKAGRRAVERYAELLRCHVVPTLGTRQI